jgi:hypothetical protein
MASQIPSRRLDVPEASGNPVWLVPVLSPPNTKGTRMMYRRIRLIEGLPNTGPSDIPLVNRGWAIRSPLGHPRDPADECGDPLVPGTVGEMHEKKSVAG